jgi:hypothetical protein
MPPTFVLADTVHTRGTGRGWRKTAGIVPNTELFERPNDW